MPKVNFEREKEYIIAGAIMIAIGIVMIVGCYILVIKPLNAGYGIADERRAYFPIWIGCIAEIIGLKYLFSALYSISKIKRLLVVGQPYNVCVYGVRLENIKFHGVNGRVVICYDSVGRQFNSRPMFKDIDALFPSGATVTVLINPKYPRDYWVVEPEW